MRKAARAVAAALCVVALATAASSVAGTREGGAGGPESPPASRPEPDSLGRRAEDQTFLTFPEWFLVFSPAEYAEHVRTHAPSTFPFAGHVGQFWQAYHAVYEATKAFPFNGEYHTMILVIGVSTTVEYGLRLGYETLVGRLTELTTSYPQTEEDRLGAEVAQDYVDFIRVRPWYEYDFTEKLRRVWGTSWFGGDMLRKWERKYALTTEYGVKAIYGWMIGLGTRASFEAALPTTVVRVSGVAADAATAVPDVKVLSTGPDGALLLSVPRYQAFTDTSLALTRAGARFDEIAGNRGDILVSTLVPAAWQTSTSTARVLFTQPILTRPERKRLALVVPVGSLHALLQELAASGATVEHVFDF